MVKIRDLNEGDVFIYHCSIMNKSYLLYVARFVDGWVCCYDINNSSFNDTPVILHPDSEVYNDLSFFSDDFRRDFL